MRKTMGGRIRIVAQCGFTVLTINYLQMFAMKVGHAWSGIFCSVASLKSFTWSQSNIWNLAVSKHQWFVSGECQKVSFSIGPINETECGIWKPQHCTWPQENKRNIPMKITLKIREDRGEVHMSFEWTFYCIMQHCWCLWIWNL